MKFFEKIKRHLSKYKKAKPTRKAICNHEQSLRRSRGECPGQNVEKRKAY